MKNGRKKPICKFWWHNCAPNCMTSGRNAIRWSDNSTNPNGSYHSSRPKWKNSNRNGRNGRRKRSLPIVNAGRRKPYWINYYKTNRSNSNSTNHAAAVVVMAGMVVRGTATIINRNVTNWKAGSKDYRHE